MASYIDTQGRTFDFSAINNVNAGGSYQQTYWVHKGTEYNAHTIWQNTPNKSSVIAFDNANLAILQGEHNATWEQKRNQFMSDYNWVFGNIDEGGICFRRNGNTLYMLRVLAYEEVDSTVSNPSYYWATQSSVATQVTLENGNLADNYIYLVDDVYHDGVLQSHSTNNFYVLTGRYTVTMGFVHTPVQGYERTYFGNLNVIASHNGPKVSNIPDLDLYPYLYMSQGGKGSWFNWTSGLGTVEDDPNEGGGYSDDGGGDGDHDDTSIDVPFTKHPPNLLINSGIIKMYNPTVTEMGNFINFIYSSADSVITNFKKLWSNPMDSIISLSIVPFNVSVNEPQEVRFCGVGSGVSMAPLSNQYVTLNCGSLHIPKYFKNFWDYNGYTSIKLWLPFIQYVELNTDEVIGSTLHIQYIIDVFTGECVAQVAVSKVDSDFHINMNTNVLYSFKGNVLTQCPISGNNFGQLYSSIMGTVMGVATGNYTQAVGNIVQSATTEKVSNQRSGSIMGCSGTLAEYKPYVIIERPVQNVPANFIKYHGYRSNRYLTLKDEKGFFKIQDGSVYLEKFGYITKQEQQELKELLESGVHA